MPILPLDHPEPFAATLGIMLYPGSDEGARAFTAQILGVSRRIPGHPLTHTDALLRGGIVTGDLFVMLLTLAHTNPALASSRSKRPGT
jgi:hypothetical protein